MLMKKHNFNIKMTKTVAAAMMENWIRLEYGGVATAIISILSLCVSVSNSCT